MAEIKTTADYELEDGLVTRVTWKTETSTIVAMHVDGETYTYSSELDGDDSPVVSAEFMSLADCTLAAYVNMGIIPPQSFDPIPCCNHH